jgi:hypothetical protein
MTGRRGGSRRTNAGEQRRDGPAAEEDLTVRGRDVTVAALRAAYAWSVRNERPQAMPEISRMVAVVMAAFGPGRGPTTPRELVTALTGRRLGTLLGHFGNLDTAMAEAEILTAEGRLTDAAYDLAAEFVVPLGVPSDEAEWLPSWTRMRSEEIRRRTFKALIEHGDDDYYVAGRRFLVEHPAGEDRDGLRELLAESGISGLTCYTEPSGDQVYRVGEGPGWWWPCKVCRWPLGVIRGSVTRVRCRYAPHKALYEVIAPQGKQRSPRLRPVGDGATTGLPRAYSAADAWCVDAGVWRHIVVPGCTELRLYEKLSRLRWNDGSAVAVELWPQLDRVDLAVHIGRRYEVDVKEYRTVWRLVTDLRERPPRAPVLLPRGHEWQRERVAALSGITVHTESDFLTMLRRELRKARK